MRKPHIPVRVSVEQDELVLRVGLAGLFPGFPPSQLEDALMSLSELRESAGRIRKIVQMFKKRKRRK